MAAVRWEDVPGPSLRGLRKRLLPSREIQAPYAARIQSSDLLPGTYEGGFKLWECAVDLASFLAALPAVRPPAHPPAPLLRSPPLRYPQHNPAASAPAACGADEWLRRRR